MAIPWRVAKALPALTDCYDEHAPGRDGSGGTGPYEGTIGDADHASRDSDHNPHVEDPPGPNVVTAKDYRRLPTKAATLAVVQAIVASRDPRMKYLIWDRGIWRSYDSSRGTPAWQREAYTGPNPHDEHFHMSVWDRKALYDDARPWAMPGVPAPPAPLRPPSPAPPSDRSLDVDLIDLRKVSDTGSTHVRGRGVKPLQRLLRVVDDGIAGPATRRALLAAQSRVGTTADAVFGPATAEKLLAEA